MNDTLTLIVSVVAIVLILFIALIIFVCTYHVRIYKSLKKPVKTMGVIGKTEYVSDSDEGEGYYVITYAYSDNAGQPHTATFRWQRNIGKAGDKIALHYDTQNPERCIADCQLRYGKNLWWKVLIILAVLIALAVFIAKYFG